MLVSLIVPTLNESTSLPFLFKRLEETAGQLKNNAIDLEAIFVDDGSTDGTPRLIREFRNSSNMAIQLLERTERGLATAVLAGFSIAKGEILGAIDSDGSHPPELIPELIASLNSADLVIASRNLPGGGVENWPFFRQWCSKIAAKFAWPLYGKVTDPMSGYFFLKKTVVESVSLNPLGYKILLEIIVKGKCGRFKEVPYVFRNRDLGKSKMDAGVIMEYGIHILNLYFWKLRRLF